MASKLERIREAVPMFPEYPDKEIDLVYGAMYGAYDARERPDQKAQRPKSVRQADIHGAVLVEHANAHGFIGRQYHKRVSIKYNNDGKEANVITYTNIRMTATGEVGTLTINDMSANLCERLGLELANVERYRYRQRGVSMSELITMLTPEKMSIIHDHWAIAMSKRLSRMLVNKRRL